MSLPNLSAPDESPLSASSVVATPVQTGYPIARITVPSILRSTIDMLDLAMLPSQPELAAGFLEDDDFGGSNPELSGQYSSQDKCWLCQRARTEEDKHRKPGGFDDELSISKVGVLVEFLPWLCQTCERSMEEEERKADICPLSSLTGVSNSSSLLGGDNEGVHNCDCDYCAGIRAMEANHEKETQELQQCWAELSSVVSRVYRNQSVSSPTYNGDGSSGEGSGASLMDIDIEKMNGHVLRLCSQDAHQLFQRLEAQAREVVIEMKVRLLKELTLDNKTPERAHGLVCVLLTEYSNLCTACQRLALVLTKLVERHLKRFNLTWQLHNKHLFHSIIFTDPVVQNCLPKVIAQLRSGLIATASSENQVSLYSKTLAEYTKFQTDMMLVGTTWKECQQQIEKYSEKQAALKVKQKMLKEDLEFFKTQRRLLEQMIPPTKNKSPASNNSHSSCEVPFNEFKKILSAGIEKRKAKEYFCPTCKQVRCSFDECSISHLITCGIINPEITDDLDDPVMTGDDEFDTGPVMDIDANGEAYLPRISRVDQSYLQNIKPPSVHSSTSSGSGSSESPIIFDRAPFVPPTNAGADLFDFSGDENGGEDLISTDDDDDDDEIYHDADPGQSFSLDEVKDLNFDDVKNLNFEVNLTTASLLKPSSNNCLDVLATDLQELAEVRPSSSSLVARMTMTKVTPSKAWKSCDGDAFMASDESTAAGHTKSRTCSAHSSGKQSVKDNNASPSSCSRARLDPLLHAELYFNRLAAEAAAKELRHGSSGGKDGGSPTLLNHPQLFFDKMHTDIDDTSDNSSAEYLSPGRGIGSGAGNCFEGSSVDGDQFSDPATSCPASTIDTLNALSLDSNPVNSSTISSIWSTTTSTDSGGGITSITTLSGNQWISTAAALGASDVCVDLSSYCAGTGVGQNKAAWTNQVAVDHRSSRLLHHGGGTCFRVSEQTLTGVVTVATPVGSGGCSGNTGTTGGTACVARPRGSPTQDGSVPAGGKGSKGSGGLLTSAVVSSSSSSAVSSSCSTTSNNQPDKKNLLSSAPAANQKQSSLANANNKSANVATVDKSQKSCKAACNSSISSTTVITATTVGTGSWEHSLKMACAHKTLNLDPAALAAGAGGKRSSVAPGCSSRLQGTQCQSPHHADIVTKSTQTGGSCANTGKMGKSAGHGSECSMHSSCERHGGTGDDGAGLSEESTGGESSSERSSATSTPSQKDGGKHCECWHCEFFGHIAPSTVPLSKNYAEVRDRLRVALKKKREGKKQGINHQTSSSNYSSGYPQSRSLEEIMKFINGVEEEERGCVGKESRPPPTGATVTSSALAAPKKSKQKKKVKEGSAVNGSGQGSQMEGSSSSTDAGSLPPTSSSETQHLNKTSSLNTAVSHDQSHSLATMATASNVPSVSIANEPKSSQPFCSTIDSKSKAKQPAAVARQTNQAASRPGSADVAGVKPGSNQSNVTKPANRSIATNCVIEQKGLSGLAATYSDNKNHVAPSQSTCNGRSDSSSSTLKERLAAALAPSAATVAPTLNGTVKKGKSTPAAATVAAQAAVNSVNSTPAVIQKQEQQRLSLEQQKQKLELQKQQLEQQLDRQKQAQNPKQQKQSVSAQQQQKQPQALQQQQAVQKQQQALQQPRQQQPVLQQQQPKVKDQPLTTAKQESCKADNVTNTRVKESGKPIAPNLVAAAVIASRSEPAVDTVKETLAASAKNKKMKRRNKSTNGGIAIGDEGFLAKDMTDFVSPGAASPDDHDDFDREIEEFKKFCFNTPPTAKREKIRVHLNLKDIFTGRGKGKSTHGCPI